MGCGGTHFHVSSDLFDPKPIADALLAFDQTLPCASNTGYVEVDAKASVYTTRSGFVRHSYDYSRDCNPIKRRYLR
ncbi:MAG: hypothetical protein LR008_01195 [Candidatus Pacebacteria bacterium]|nr:hypothetical protein [Candidatus Paceibacterota bacterium]